MTYLKPKKWWMRLGKFMAKCQNLTIEKQYEKGARWFDLRISIPYENGTHVQPIFSHGLIDYISDIDAVLSFLSAKKDTYCRIILEKGGTDELELFKFYVLSWMHKYPTLNVTQIAKKGVWQNVIEPNAKVPFGLKDQYASCNGDYPQYQNWPGILRNKAWSGLLIDDLWPWIYAKLNNKKNLEKYKGNNDVILLIDFIGMK